MTTYHLNPMVHYQKIAHTDAYHLYDGILRQHYTVSEKEIQFWKALKKTNTLAQLPALTAYQKEEVEEFFAIFESIGLVNPQSKKMPFHFSLAFLKRNAWTVFLEKCLLLLALFSSVFFTVLLFYSDWSALFIASIRWPAFSWSWLFSGLLLFLVSSLLHEMGHWLFAVNRQVMVPALSLNFRKGTVQVDTTGMQFLPNKKAQLLIYFAGPLIQFILSGLFGFGLCFFPENHWLWLGLLINACLLVLNLSMLIAHSDGTQILALLLDSDLLAQHLVWQMYWKNRKNLPAMLRYLLDGIWLAKGLLLGLGISLALQFFLN